MELKKAIEVLNKLEFEDYEYTYNGLYHNIDTILIKQAFDTVLEELNNRIPKKEILEFARRLEDIQDKEDEKLENFGFDLGGRQFIPVRNIVADELRKLLNKE